jgi:predicted dehydrogenase
MKLIIIGACGHQGNEYYNLLKNKYNISAVVDTNFKTLNERYPNIKKFATVNDAIKEIDFDAAIIAIPHIYHTSVSIPLILNNKKIIKEKPLTINLAEYEKLKINDFSNTHLSIIVQRNFNDVFSDALENLIHLGKIYNFKYEYYLSLNKNTKGWRANFDIARGGVVLDMGYHIIDIILKFFGSPQDFYGAISYCYDYSGYSLLEDSATLSFKYNNNQLHGSVHLNRHYYCKKEEFTIIGSNGILILNPTSYKIYDRNGNIIKEYEKQFLNDKQQMFDFYLNPNISSTFLKNHIKHHKNIVEIIDNIYKQSR